MFGPRLAGERKTVAAEKGCGAVTQPQQVGEETVVPGLCKLRMGGRLQARQIGDAAGRDRGGVLRHDVIEAVNSSASPSTLGRSRYPVVSGENGLRISSVILARSEP